MPEVHQISIDDELKNISKHPIDVSEQLADKANQSDLNTTNSNVSANTATLVTHTSQIASNVTAISNIGSGSPKGTYATLSALQTAYPSGTTGIYVVTADGKWYYWNGSAWTAGGTYQATATNPNGKYAFISDPLDYNTTTKVLSWSATWAYGYGLSRTLIPTGSITVSSITASPYPLVYLDTVNSTIVVADPSLAAQSGYALIGMLWLADLTKSVLTSKLTVNSSPNIVPFGRYGFISDSIDYNTTTQVLTWPATYIFGADFVRTAIAAGSLNLSSYGATGVPILFYDTVNKTIVAQGAAATASNKYMLLGAIWLGNLSQSILNFKLTINGASQNVANPSYFSGKKWDVMGDSITAFNEYQTTVNSIINFKTINEYGIGGTCLASTDSNDTSSMAYRIQNVDFTADLITVFGGTNDWGNIPAKPLGQMGDTQNTTVYGAIDSIIKTVLTNAPTSRLIFIAPLQRDFEGTASTTLNGWSETTVNALGYKLSDVVKAIQDVCGKYGVPVLDLYHNSGITQLNLSQTTRDGLHPSTAVGMPLIGRQIAAFINKV